MKVSSTSPIAITLPAATGSGNEYTFRIDVVATGTAHTIKVANTADILAGFAIQATASTTLVTNWLTTATDDTISVNGTTKGGLVGDKIVIVDVATARFHVEMIGGGSGTAATPFSASV